MLGASARYSDLHILITVFRAEIVFVCFSVKGVMSLFGYNPKAAFFMRFQRREILFPTQLRSRNGPFSFNESAAPERSRDGCFKQNGDPGSLPYKINPGAFRVIFYAAPWPSRKMP